MDFTEFARNCSWLDPCEDPLYAGFIKLRVWSTDITERPFKLNALTLLRKSGLYKRFRLKSPAIEAVERNLVEAHLSSLAVFLLCALYGVSLVVLEKRFFYVCGDSPTVALRKGKLGRIDTWGLYELNPVKPLYAISYYCLAQLKDMAAKLRVQGDTKAQLYDAISIYLKDNSTQ